MRIFEDGLLKKEVSLNLEAMCTLECKLVNTFIVAYRFNTQLLKEKELFGRHIRRYVPCARDSKRELVKHRLQVQKKNHSTKKMNQNLTAQAPLGQYSNYASSRPVFSALPLPRL